MEEKIKLITKSIIKKGGSEIVSIDLQSIENLHVFFYL